MDQYLARMQTYCVMALVYHFFSEEWGHPWGAVMLFFIGVWTAFTFYGDRINAWSSRS